MSRDPVVYKDDDEIPLPTRWRICSHCQGDGMSSAYLGAFTGDQMREDPDFAEEYMQGRYDRTCDECNGSGKVKVVDYHKCDPELYELYIEQRRESRAVDEMAEMERRMGA